MNPRDVWVIARFELARHLRSRHAIVAGILLIGFCAFGSYRLAEFADRLSEVGTKLGPALGFITGAIESTTGLPATDIAGLLEDHPPVLVVLFALVLAFMPVLCLILVYDQTATDIETRHVRFLLFRSDRVSIYLGKALGALALLSLAIGAVLVVVGVFLAVRSNALEGMTGVVYLGRIWLTATLYALPFVALLGLMSALVGRARRSFGFTLLYAFAVMTLAGLLSLVHEDLRSIRYLFPSVDRFDLMLDGFRDVRGTALYLSVYTLVAGALGLWRFRTRDL